MLPRCQCRHALETRLRCMWMFAGSASRVRCECFKLFNRASQDIVATFQANIIDTVRRTTRHHSVQNKVAVVQKAWLQSASHSSTPPPRSRMHGRRAARQSMRTELSISGQSVWPPTSCSHSGEPSRPSSWKRRYGTRLQGGQGCLGSS